MGKSYLYRTDFIALQMTNLNISFGFRFIDSLSYNSCIGQIPLQMTN
jgi:hypothetical protein